MNNMLKKWELWVTLVINVLAGLQVGGTIPSSGPIYTASVVVLAVLTNIVALAGRQVIRGKHSRSSDAVSVIEITPTVPATLPAKRKRVRK